MNPIISFDDTKFLNLVRPFVSRADDPMIKDYLRRSVRIIYRALRLDRRIFPQTAAGKGREFYLQHPGSDFGLLVNFYEVCKEGWEAGDPLSFTDLGDTIQPPGDPLIDIGIDTDTGAQTTRIFMDYFGSTTGIGGIKAAAVCALLPDDTADGVRADIFREYDLLIRAGALKEMAEYLASGQPKRDWNADYDSRIVAAQHRFNPRPTIGTGQGRDFAIGPPGGGYPLGGYFRRR